MFDVCLAWTTELPFQDVCAVCLLTCFYLFGQTTRNQTCMNHTPFLEHCIHQGCDFRKWYILCIDVAIFHYKINNSFLTQFLSVPSFVTTQQEMSAGDINKLGTLIALYHQVRTEVRTRILYCYGKFVFDKAFTHMIYKDLQTYVICVAHMYTCMYVNEPLFMTSFVANVSPSECWTDTIGKLILPIFESLMFEGPGPCVSACNSLRYKCECQVG